MARAKSRMTGVKRAREAALRERRAQKAEKKRAAREARAAESTSTEAATPQEVEDDELTPSA